ncbi:hypothetical protein BJX63DRAFT_437394 [Aspergillus granulosus]|uniref:MADS-box domain-containing protein n=1 Tax=Aspergillus granulosus TaxID=176169 RepID=A0ABR4GV73_9EURO
MSSHSVTTKSSPRHLRQMRDRRRKTLINKVHEYSMKCGADIWLGIRLRENGKVFTVSIDPAGFWSFQSLQLDTYYPTPIHITEKDLQAKPAKDYTTPGHP